MGRRPLGVTNRGFLIAICASLRRRRRRRLKEERRRRGVLQREGDVLRMGKNKVPPTAFAEGREARWERERGEREREERLHTRLRLH